MCSGLYKNYRSGARGCKWLRLRHRKYNRTTPYDNTNTKIFFVFFYLIRFLRSGQKTKKRASAPGCKWQMASYTTIFINWWCFSITRIQICFWNFCIIYGFCGAIDTKKFLRWAEKNKKKTRPKKWKVQQICWNAPKKNLSAFRRLFVFSRAKPVVAALQH